MTTKVQILILICLIIGVCYIINLIRKNKLELKYSLSWLGVALLVLIMDCFPNIMQQLADLLGIASPINMVFFFGFCFMLIIILTLTVALSITASSVKRLNQKIGILDKKINELENK